MTIPKLHVRPLETGDIKLIADYWLLSSDEYLIGMGVDLNKLPERSDFEDMLRFQINTPLAQKPSYALIWVVNNTPIGHCNVNAIKYAESAYMHLHIWVPKQRHQGLGTKLVKASLKIFFHDLKLKTIYCEPYALNPAPNKALKKIGFNFIKKHTTVPGSLNFEQPVNLWSIREEEIV